MRNALFGIYLKQAPGSRVERCEIRGIKEKAAGEKGSGIHVWNTDGFTLLDNDVSDVRDGVYIQSSPHGTIRGNRAHDLRYGLHYMYSDDNVFEDNVFENGDAGTAVMYSRRLTFRRNQFLRNRGFASVGLLLKSCDDVLAEHNLIADNARGVFIEGSERITIHENVIAQSDIALVDLRLRVAGDDRRQLLRGQPRAAVAGRPADRHGDRGQLLVGQRRARSGWRRTHRSAVSPLQPVRSLPRQPDRRGPVLAEPFGLGHRSRGAIVARARGGARPGYRAAGASAGAARAGAGAAGREVGAAAGLLASASAMLSGAGLLLAGRRAAA